MKNIVFSVALGALVAVGFSGCGEEEIKTAEYFKQHPKELKKKMEECKKAQSMSESKKKECDNAFFAQQTSNDAWTY